VDKRKGIIYMATSPSGKSYIGKTISKLSLRISGHHSDSNKYTYAFANALRKYARDEWVWSILYSDIPISQMNNMEKWCVANYNTYYKGYNSTSGGEASPSHDPETRKKMSRANIGRKQSKETIEKRVAHLRGKPCSKETRIKIGNANRGRICSEVARANMSKAHIGKKQSKESNEKRSKTLTGRIFTEDHKRKIGESNRGKAPTDEQRKKMSLAHIGKNIGEENPQSKLTRKYVEEIRHEYNFNNVSTKSLAQNYGVDKTTIMRVLNNITWVSDNYTRTRYRVKAQNEKTRKRR